MEGESSGWNNPYNEENYNYFEGSQKTSLFAQTKLESHLSESLEEIEKTIKHTQYTAAASSLAAFLIARPFFGEIVDNYSPIETPSTSFLVELGSAFVISYASYFVARNFSRDYVFNGRWQKIQTNLDNAQEIVNNHTNPDNIQWNQSRYNPFKTTKQLEQYTTKYASYIPESIRTTIRKNDNSGGLAPSIYWVKQQLDIVEKPKKNTHSNNTLAEMLKELQNLNKK